MGGTVTWSKQTAKGTGEGVFLALFVQLSTRHAQCLTLILMVMATSDNLGAGHRSRCRMHDLTDAQHSPQGRNQRHRQVKSPAQTYTAHRRSTSNLGTVAPRFFSFLWKNNFLIVRAYTLNHYLGDAPSKGRRSHSPNTVICGVCKPL